MPYIIIMAICSNRLNSVFYVRKSIQWQNPNNKPTDRNEVQRRNQTAQNYNSCILRWVDVRLDAKYWTKRAEHTQHSSKWNKCNNNSNSNSNRQDRTTHWAWNEIVNARVKYRTQKPRTQFNFRRRREERCRESGRDADLLENCYLFTNVTFNVCCFCSWFYGRQDEIWDSFEPCKDYANALKSIERFFAKKDRQTEKARETEENCWVHKCIGRAVRTFALKMNGTETQHGIYRSAIVDAPL